MAKADAVALLCLAARGDRLKLLVDRHCLAPVQILLDRRGGLLITLAPLDPLCLPGLHYSKRSRYALNRRSLRVVLTNTDVRARSLAKGLGISEAVRRETNSKKERLLQVFGVQRPCLSGWSGSVAFCRVASRQRSDGRADELRAIGDIEGSGSRLTVDAAAPCGDTRHDRGSPLRVGRLVLPTLEAARA